MKRRETTKAAYRKEEGHTLRNKAGTGGTMWKYEQLRAGEVYAKFMFQTREEAETFASEMTKVEPDLFCRIEPVEARAVWN
jgi:hypothetical protein